MSKGKQTRVKYVGPPDQINDDVPGRALEPGETYEVDAELAELLVRSSVHWQLGTKAATEAIRNDEAAEAASEETT